MFRRKPAANPMLGWFDDMQSVEQWRANVDAKWRD